jgi:hypothetical protein
MDLVADKADERTMVPANFADVFEEIVWDPQTCPNRQYPQTVVSALDNHGVLLWVYLFQGEEKKSRRRSVEKSVARIAF